MPLYEYECDTNGHRFEVIQKYSDPPPAACPTCGATVHKLFSSPAIQFKGSGFYITDYARAGKGDGGNGQAGKAGGTASESKDAPGKSDSTSSESSQPKTESKSESTSESKTASKSETKNSSSPADGT
jgi:putative FmdB family regulatory protein